MSTVTDRACRMVPLNVVEVLVFWLIIPITVAWLLGLWHETGHCVGNAVTGGSGMEACLSNIELWKTQWIFLGSTMYVVWPETGVYPVGIVMGPLFGIVGGLIVGRMFRYSRLEDYGCAGRNMWKRFWPVGLVGIIVAIKDTAYGFLPVALGFLGNSGDGINLYTWLQTNWFLPWPRAPEITVLGEEVIVLLDPLYLVFVILLAICLRELAAYVNDTPLVCGCERY